MIDLETVRKAIEHKRKTLDQAIVNTAAGLGSDAGQIAQTIHDIDAMEAMEKDLVLSAAARPQRKRA